MFIASHNVPVPQQVLTLDTITKGEVTYQHQRSNNIYLDHTNTFQNKLLSART